MGDSKTKKFGDRFIDKLGGELKRPAPVFGESLFAGAGDATRNAWSTATGNANELIASGGYTAPMTSAMSTFGDVSRGYGDIARAGLTPEQRAAMGDYGGLEDTYADLSTAYDPNSDAYKRLRGNIRDDTLTDVASLFASNGRWGSDIMSESASEGVADALAGLDYTNMQNDVNNRYRSADSRAGVLSNLFTMGQTEVGNRMGALSGQQGAAGAQFDAGQAGINNRNAAIDALAAVGAGQDADAQGALLGRADLYDRRKGAELDRLAEIAAIFGGNGPVDASNEAPWWQQIAGYIAGNAGRAIGGGAVR